MNYIKKTISDCCKRNKYSQLHDLSFTGEIFNEFNIRNLIKNVKPNYIYISDDYKISNYHTDNILIKITEKIKDD
jgi:hypothetical protein